MTATPCTVLVLVLLWDSVGSQSDINSLKAAAGAWGGELPCGKWDCECLLRSKRGCTCASEQLSELEDQTFLRMWGLSKNIDQLGNSINDVTGGMRVAFRASMSPRTTCFGPFTTRVSIPYSDVYLNHGRGYNPGLGIFTAPCNGLYSFSFTVYSKMANYDDRMYYKVQLMKNGEVMTSTWEDNRQDSEDSSSQSIVLQMEKGGQVYVALWTGRHLCGDSQGRNTFSGFLIYPSLPE
ncbi:cerebellin-1-like [Genypterus blacodes]|uniref:cerebellin-1-like n=1 Tax=Genypterus blacodes TaxID=154954 RepID=UPI003F757424